LQLNDSSAEQPNDPRLLPIRSASPPKHLDLDPGWVSSLAHQKTWSARGVERWSGGVGGVRDAKHIVATTITITITITTTSANVSSSHGLMKLHQAPHRITAGRKQKHEGHKRAAVFETWKNVTWYRR
jgi:hypothetical protein